MPRPRRLVNVEAARNQFGPAIDTLSDLLFAADPLADALVEATAPLGQGACTRMVDEALARGAASVANAPKELQALFDELEHVPAWLDKTALEHGGELLLRAGWFGGLALATSLLLGYASPGGNKPLVFSGRLYDHAPRRLIETSRFVQATCKPNGLARDGEAFAITVRVRMMHAHIRRMILRSGRWSTEDWAIPANQHDMGGTGLLFSVVVIDTLSRMGFQPEPDEIHLYMQLWRYSGYLMGVHPEVLPTSYAEGHRLADMIAATEEGPDDDSRRLSRALFESGSRVERGKNASKPPPRQVVLLGQGLIRGSLGEPLADLLDVPKHGYRHAFPLLRGSISGLERATRRLPRFARDEVRRRAIAQGHAYWDMIVRTASDPLTFVPPDRLLGIAREFASPATRRGSTLASVARPR